MELYGTEDKIYQAFDAHIILVGRIHSALVWLCTWDSWTVRKIQNTTRLIL